VLGLAALLIRGSDHTANGQVLHRGEGSGLTNPGDAGNAFRDVVNPEAAPGQHTMTLSVSTTRPAGQSKTYTDSCGSFPGAFPGVLTGLVGWGRQKIAARTARPSKLAVQFDSARLDQIA